jgi:hypothetical protein
MNERAELERVDRPRIHLGKALPYALEQQSELLLVVTADAFAGGALFRSFVGIGHRPSVPTLRHALNPQFRFGLGRSVAAGQRPSRSPFGPPSAGPGGPRLTPAETDAGWPRGPARLSTSTLGTSPAQTYTPRTGC